VKKALTKLTILCLLIALSACKKKNKCDGVLTGMQPTSTIIELRDRQDRDLLNPATPGHYDTAAIKTLNADKPVQVRVATASGPIVKDRIYLEFILSATKPGYQLRLSNTVSDALIGGFEDTSGSCYVSTRLTSFSYNGVTYPVSSGQNFIIKKGEQ
jgi:hypothetical protein